jgi:ABC-type glucose/galactose transport system permease subunit
MPLLAAWRRYCLSNWVHIGFEVALALVSVVLAIYTFRLYNRFFKGGFFGPSFRILGFSAFLLAVAYVSDVILDLTGIKIGQLEISHFILSLSFLVALFYGIHSLYKAWTKLVK